MADAGLVAQEAVGLADAGLVALGLEAPVAAGWGLVVVVGLDLAVEEKVVGDVCLAGTN